jgi:hypothetical protein
MRIELSAFQPFHQSVPEVGFRLHSLSEVYQIAQSQSGMPLVVARPKHITERGDLVFLIRQDGEDFDEIAVHDGEILKGNSVQARVHNYPSLVVLDSLYLDSLRGGERGNASGKADRGGQALFGCRHLKNSGSLDIAGDGEHRADGRNQYGIVVL